MSSEEQKKRSYNERFKRYREKHQLVTFGTKITRDRYNEIAKKISEKGITVKQFIEEAIDKFLRE